MTDQPSAPSGSAYVLRALAASEIAETCSQPAIKESFTALTATWLEEAERAFQAERRARAADGGDAAR